MLFRFNLLFPNVEALCQEVVRCVVRPSAVVISLTNLFSQRVSWEDQLGFINMCTYCICHSNAWIKAAAIVVPRKQQDRR